MSDRPCDICKRRLWDGGHAINSAECTHPGDEFCSLTAERDRLQRDLADVVAMLRDLERETYIRGVSERARLILDRFAAISKATSQ